MSQPNFLVIGAQKAGTTYLCSCLAKHQDVYFSNPKELMYFNKKGVNQVTFKNYLEDHFSPVSGEKWVGEGSTTYLQWPLALRNIKKFLGLNLKIFICLRHPVEKAISFYIHNWRRERLTGNESILDFGMDSISLSPYKTSEYASHIQRWLKVYDREQIQFLLFDTLVGSNRKFIQRATDFLEIPELKNIDSKKINAGFPVVMVDEYLVVKADAQGGQVVPRFALSDLEEMQRKFNKDISRTETLIDMDLASWKKLPAL